MISDAANQLPEVVERTQSRIRAYIAGMGIAPHVVDDLAQEVFLELGRGLHKLPDDADGEILWLKGIAKRVCFNYLRRTKRRNQKHEEAVQELLCRVETPFEAKSGETMREALRQCMQKLKGGDRELLRQRYEDDRDYSEMAAATGRAESALRVYLHRLRQSLRQCIRLTLEVLT